MAVSEWESEREQKKWKRGGEINWIKLNSQIEWDEIYLLKLEN